MTEIKYRAWDTINEKMITWSDMVKEPELMRSVLGGERFLTMPPKLLSIPMQFTGQKDCAGKDIYDGYILDKKYKVQVFYNDGAFWVKSKAQRTILLYSWLSNRERAQCPSEIIGNIYEHEHLLEVKNE